MKICYAITLAIMAFIVVSSFTTTPDTDIPYPEGYRRWTHIKSGVLGPEHPNIKYRGFNHIYANEKAFEGYASGTFADGSILVFDVLEASTANNYTAEGKRHHIDVMVKDSAKFPSTGGWGYAQFDESNPTGKLNDEQSMKCYNCHLKQGDHVFSEFRK